MKRALMIPHNLPTSKIVLKLIFPRTYSHSKERKMSPIYQEPLLTTIFDQSDFNPKAPKTNIPNRFKLLALPWRCFARRIASICCISKTYFKFTNPTETTRIAVAILPVMPLKIAIPPPAAIPKARTGAKKPNMIEAGSISVGPVL